MDVEVCHVAELEIKSKPIAMSKPIRISEPFTSTSGPKVSPSKKRRREEEVIVIDSDSDSGMKEPDYSLLDVVSKPETPRREVKGEPALRRSARQRPQVKYHFDVQAEVRDFLDTEVKIEVGSPPKKRK